MPTEKRPEPAPPEPGEELDWLIRLCGEEFNRDPSTLSQDTPFWELGSLDTIEVVMYIEELCDLGVPDEEAERLQTIGDLARYIASHRNNRLPLPAAAATPTTEDLPLPAGPDRSDPQPEQR